MNLSLYQRLLDAPDDTLHHVVNMHIKAGLLDDLHGLISPEFMWAKRKRYGSHQDFVEDIERTIEVLQNSRLDDLPRLIFYSMLYATLRSMAINVTPEVLKVLADLGHMERAVAYAEILTDPFQKAEAFQILGGGGKNSREKEKNDGVRRKLNRKLIQRAFAESSRIESSYDKAKFLSTLASDLARIGDMEAALSCVQQIDAEEPYDLRDKTLQSIPVDLALSGKKNEAFQVYEQLEEGYSKTNILKDLVKALAKAGLIIDALNLVVRIDRNEDVVKEIAFTWQVKEAWLQDAVKEAKEVQDTEARTEFISDTALVIDRVQQIISEERNEPNPYEIARAAKDRAELLIWLGRYDEAFEILRTIDTTIFPIITFGIGSEFSFFARALLLLGRFDDAEYLEENGWTERWFSKMLPTLVDISSNLRQLINEGKLDKVFTEIDQIEPEEHQADAMLLIGLDLARLGRMRDVADFYERNKDDGHFDATAHELAIHLAKNGMFTEAELLMGGFIDSGVRFKHVAEVAGGLISHGKITEISTVIRKHIRKTSERLEAASYIANKLDQEDHAKALEILELGLIDCEEIELTFEDRADIFAFAAAGLVQAAHAQKAVRVAKYLAREKPDLYSGIIGEAIGNSSNDSQAQDLLTEVLEFVATIPDDSDETMHLERQTILNYLVGDLAKKNKFELSTIVISKMEDSFWQKPLALAELAGRIAAGDKKKAHLYLDQAKKMAKKLVPSGRKKGQGTGHLVLNILQSFMMPRNIQHIAKWGMLSPKTPFFSPDLFNVEAAMAFIAVELLNAGWIEKALEIGEALTEERIKLQIRTYAAIRVAEHGNLDDAHKVIEGQNTAIQGAEHLRNLETLGHEISDQKMIFRAQEFQSLLESGDIKGAQNIAKKLIDDTDIANRGKVIGALVLVLAANDLIEETLTVLKSISDELPDKIQIQIACIWYFLNEKNYSVAEKIADSVEDLSWKTLFKALIKIKMHNPTDQNEYFLQLKEFINHSIELSELTQSDAVRLWLAKESAAALAKLDGLEDIFLILSSIPNLKFRYQAMSELSAILVKKGMVEDAHLIIREVRDQKMRDAAITLIIDAFADLTPEKALQSFYTFLQDAIETGYKSTCHAISQVIPLAVKLMESERVPDLLWATHNEIIRIDSFWATKNYDTSAESSRIQNVISRITQRLSG